MQLRLLYTIGPMIVCVALIALLSPENKYHFPFTQTVNGADSHNSSHSLLGAFFYQWYKGDERGYEGWSAARYNPPDTWASHYIPFFGSSKFDPAHQLYDSSDVSVLKRQLIWLKAAGIQFAISSWNGRNTTTDRTFSYILNYTNNLKDNPYPDFRWSLVYEKPYYVNLTTQQVIHDLDYIKSKYSLSPFYLKINARPVLFIYNGNLSDVSDFNHNINWSTIRSQTGFYLVMRNFIQNEGGDLLKSIDGWYEYKPTIRYEQDFGYSAFVSPGFWKFREATALIRNTTDFETAVQKLARANVSFKLIETWNEWFEGTQIEPGQQIGRNVTSNKYTPTAPPYGDVYIKILAKYFKNNTNNTNNAG
jgi:hypothetical protein